MGNESSAPAPNRAVYQQETALALARDTRGPGTTLAKRDHAVLLAKAEDLAQSGPQIVDIDGVRVEFRAPSGLQGRDAQLGVRDVARFAKAAGWTVCLEPFVAGALNAVQTIGASFCKERLLFSFRNIEAFKEHCRAFKKRGRVGFVVVEPEEDLRVSGVGYVMCHVLIGLRDKTRPTRHAGPRGLSKRANAQRQTVDSLRGVARLGLA